jgi:NADH:ubiquinone oxidoreductase subunit 5 (subunit L)/multisubunit Na+/H+ antiporter MnhA subunit/multisubunit Na+/H+ antiporter MnhB subunit
MLTLTFIAVFAPLGVLPLLAFFGRMLGPRVGWVALLAPILSAASLLALLVALPVGGREVVSLPWIPSLGMDLTLLIDGLSLFFGLVVTGMGVLVIFYATFYLDDHYEKHAQFYTYLLLFMTAMLGTVLSGNLLLLVVFWELTGLTSFLLIGFLHGKEESRAGARMALLVTGGTGLVMLAGVVVVGQLAGTYELSALLGGALADAPRGTLTLAFVLMIIGAFGKSAQFPFHFWLPNAMAAPTPVSAYLHSATMVKLGVFLVARMFPVFQPLELWPPVLMLVGFGTMALAALLALLSHDLKAILAFSTVSQLGFFIGFYGMAPDKGSSGDLLHIASHALYKGCLFMVVGIVDHATGIRDVRKLGGLARRMPLLAGIAAVAAATMVGVTGTTGFISKEYILKAKFAHWEGDTFLNGYPLAMMIAASIMLVAAAARLVHGVFFGRPAVEAEKHFHAPGFWIQFPPLVLAVGCLVGGVLPGVFGELLNAFYTPGLHAPDLATFELWHGLTREFAVSLAILGTGVILYALLHGPRWDRLAIPRWLRFDVGFEAGVEGLPYGAKRLTAALRSDRPFDYLPIVIAFSGIVLGGYLLAERQTLVPAMPALADFDPLRTFVVVLIAIALGLVIGMKRWSGQLIALSIVGFLITFYFVLFQAPDLAMTQILTESATLLLVLLLLSRFPRSAEMADLRGPGTRTRRVLAVGLGVLTGVVAMLLTVMALQPRHPDPAGEFYLANTVPLAHGANAVNTILVDFRGFDTLMEITVLLVAGLGAMGLLSRYKRTEEEYAAGAKGPAGYGVGRGEDDPENGNAKH